ncbi:class II aldolase/adducin family protein [Aestuariirhabdus sp. Z084]|uniref:class II aldolase/adducin family protein n=1 Tax=Aestuariirhabdus haliotis TaxID=2918751 RepID=UPI00201B40E9|nr:class II aldolase/adducin family protein [Aestuariirhabdus haliotis]MCL6416973.1 class II aldolase/adducin family protein [Aestuariirhabdus haliotis]MCL6421020.1 class II aldolase/adducin family protein [Aestuariirhabdus haliotis]
MTKQAVTVADLTVGSRQFSVPMPPVFESKEAEQLHVKQRLAAAFRIFAQQGFDEGLAGHITVRDPIDPHTFWVNPIARHFSLMCVSDLVRVDHQGNIVEGHSAINNAAFAIHSRIHHHRPDVNAVAHAHTVYGRAFAALNQPLKAISQDACLFYNNHGVFSEFTGVVSSQSEGDLIAESLAEGVGTILVNHGLLTVGKSVDACCANFVLMDSCCHSQLLAQAAGELQQIPHEIAEKTRTVAASDIVTWGNFQPLYEKLLARDDSFLQ